MVPLIRILHLSHLVIQPSNPLSANHISNCPAIHSSIHQTVCSPTNPSIHVSSCPSIHLSMCIYTHIYIYIYIYLFTWFIYIYLFIFIYKSILYIYIYISSFFHCKSIDNNSLSIHNSFREYVLSNSLRISYLRIFLYFQKTSLNEKHSFSSGFVLVTNGSLTSLVGKCHELKQHETYG